MRRPLIGRLLEVTRQTLLAQDAEGVRPSHFRLLLSHVPPSGVTITELAAALLTTQQGVGQVVTQLQGRSRAAAERPAVAELRNAPICSCQVSGRPAGPCRAWLTA